MRRNNTVSPLLWAALTLPVLYLAALLASGYEEGMTVFDLMGHFSGLLERPFAIRWTPHTPKFMLGALLIYGFSVVLYCSTRENRRPGEEHGSAKWGSPKLLDRKYRDKAPFQNTILTQNVRMGLNGKVHRRNLLQIVIGGSGAGKTRFFCKPNLMQANCSFLVTDPKGETMRAVAPLLIEKGYVIKVFDLIDTDRSDAFNPFPYLKDDKDAMKLVNNLIKNTTPKNSTNNDPFWEKSEIALDTALILYLLHEAPPEEQNLEMVMYMIENGGAREDDDDFQSPLDMLFEALEEEEPDHVAVREYKIFKQAAGKTAKSILLSAAVRLSAFILPQITRITSRDDMELGLMGERKQAVFAIIPDNDGTFNYLVGMLYTCAFQALYYQADKVHQGALPVPTRLLVADGTGAVGAAGHAAVAGVQGLLAQQLGDILVGGRLISAQIHQRVGVAQKPFPVILEQGLEGGNVLEYNGGHDVAGAHGGLELAKVIRQGDVAELVHHQADRELMTPDEVRTLDNDYALLFIRGERPVMDKKYDILKHPYIKLTEDGGAAPYVHHPGLTYAQADLSVPFESLDYIEILE